MVEVSYLDTKDFTQAEYKKMLALLSAARREKAERYCSVRDRLLSAAAGYLLDTALRQRGLSEREVVMRYGAHGKPYIEGLHFNLTHSGTVAAMAVGEGEVGIDLEMLRPLPDGIAERVCTERERAFLAERSEEERAEMFFRLWTAKESVAKFSGSGLNYKPSEIEVCLTRGTATQCGKRISATLKAYPLQGYALTVCADEAFVRELKKAGL